LSIFIWNASALSASTWRWRRAPHARGIVLEVYRDGAKGLAVHCPLADFFGDGCNGRSMDFTSNLIECAP